MKARLQRRRCRFYRLHLEVLEDRALLSIFTVDRLTDTGQGSALAGDLRYCITQATSGQDTINFGVTGTINLTKPLPDLTKSVSIAGPGADLLTVRRDTASAYRIFTVGKSATVKISGLTLANGTSQIFGGGIYNDGTLTVSNSTLSGNSANLGGGGGIYNSPSGSLTVGSSNLSNNKVSDPNGNGGGILNDGALTFSSSIVSGNHAAGGAGIYNSSSGTLIVSNSSISSNSGANDGGGIYNSGTLTVSDSTVSSNTAIDSGGGIQSGGTLTVDNSTFSGNFISDAFGSAINASGGPVKISNSTITGNTARTGTGAIYLSSAMATVSNCVISANTSLSGGGIVNGGTLTVGNSTISGNISGGAGTAGGIDNRGTLAVGNSTISSNSGWAGGIWNRGTLTVSNSTISGNSGGFLQSMQTAGGIANVAQNSDATIMLTNATIANNIVSGSDRTGSQLFGGQLGAGTGKATVEFRNTVISGDGSKPNLFADMGGNFVSDGHNLSSDDGSGFLTASGDVIDANPLLGPLQDDGGPTQTMALLPGSPAIDAGDNTNAPATDQRDFARIVNTTTDIGAFESRGFTITVAGGNNQQAIVNSAFASSLRVSVSSLFREPVQGGLVAFTAPGNTAGATFPTGNTAIIDASGQCSAAAAANNIAGSYVVTASANGASAANFSLTNLPAITLSPASLPRGTAGVAYSQELTAGGGAGGPFSFAVTAGALLAGFTLSSSGVLSGSTTTAMTIAFTATATDAGGSSGSQAFSLAIDPAAAATFVVTGFPSPVTAGVLGTVAITAQDAFGNVATGYVGAVTFSTGDPQATLPANAPLTAGIGTFSVILKTAGTQWLTASDTVNAAISGGQSGIVVNPAGATHLVIDSPSSVTAGSAFDISVQAVDPFGNTATGYVGTVIFTSTDANPGVLLPSDYVFTAADSGVHIFPSGATLRTVGSQTITTTDTLDSSVTGGTSVVVNRPVFFVTTALDSGAGSFRQAILDADATPGPDIIRFAIGTGIQTINVASPLPAITEPVIIDGTTQPGYTGAPLIELNGNGAGPDADGLLITAGGSVVRGLVINRFSLNGIELRANGGNVIQGDYLGTDVTGTLGLGNGVGVYISTSNNTIGGTTLGDGNVISNNFGDGIVISNGTANVVQGNSIGGNANNGVRLLNVSGNTIGGTVDGADNAIAYNGHDGVLVDSGSGNGIRRNAIYSHTSGLGIELVNSGNNRLLFPVLTSATSDGLTTTIVGQLQSAPNTALTVEFFANPVSNPSGFGEGKQFLGSSTVTTNDNGTADFTVTFAVAVPPSQFVAATATDPDSNTSAFSNCVGVAGPAASPALASGTRQTGGDATVVRMPIASINGSPRTDAEVANTPVVPGDDRQLLERRALDVLFGKRSQAELRLANSAPVGYCDDCLSSRIAEAIRSH